MMGDSRTRESPEADSPRWPQWCQRAIIEKDC